MTRRGASRRSAPPSDARRDTSDSNDQEDDDDADVIVLDVDKDDSGSSGSDNESSAMAMDQSAAMDDDELSTCPMLRPFPLCHADICLARG